MDNQSTKWAELLKTATSEPGTLQKAYSAFWNYSSGNQMLAIEQCRMRGIEPGQLASYRKWQELERQVRKGEKAIALWMPITVKRAKPESESDDDQREKSTGTKTAFVVRRNWFVLGQTDGKEFI